MLSHSFRLKGGFREPEFREYLLQFVEFFQVDAVLSRRQFQVVSLMILIELVDLDSP